MGHVDEAGGQHDHHLARPESFAQLLADALAKGLSASLGHNWQHVQ
jgi:hypothetical protein